MARRKYVVGNWKMHGLSSDLAEIKAIADGAKPFRNVDVALCLPAILIERAARAVTDIPIGAQDVHFADKGAHTGCVSVAMLRDAGAILTIVGHSERREAQHEGDDEVRQKAEAALAGGLKVILCVGESLDVREAGMAVATVQAQLDASLPRVSGVSSLAIAYEPIWAIGTGKVASNADIGEMHSALRERLVAAYGEAGNEIRILYGGSVNAANAAEIFAVADVDGALVGGASLTAEKFVPIVAAAASAP
ncbi:MAG TPA: triose-phosphate isomerase [Sphingomicrobium sp.]|nr:triose-phosphate isomerase [Sphingomicrobium sp.]